MTEKAFYYSYLTSKIISIFLMAIIMMPLLIAAEPGNISLAVKKADKKTLKEISRIEDKLKAMRNTPKVDDFSVIGRDLEILSSPYKQEYSNAVLRQWLEVIDMVDRINEQPLDPKDIPGNILRPQLFPEGSKVQQDYEEAKKAAAERYRKYYMQISSRVMLEDKLEILNRYIKVKCSSGERDAEEANQLIDTQLSSEARKEQFKGICAGSSKTPPLELGTDAPHATLERTLVLHPSGISLQIPQTVSGGSQVKQFVTYLSKTALERLHRTSGDEWDGPYSLIVNTLLPFESCLAHIGTEPFGPGALSFADLQMRVYLINGPMKPILEKIVENSLQQTVRTFHDIKTTPQQTVNEWTKIAITANMFFRDYGAPATVDFYIKEFNKQTIVLVFMYSPDERKPWTPSIADIVDSVQQGK
jgi:hypothetical protein